MSMEIKKGGGVKVLVGVKVYPETRKRLQQLADKNDIKISNMANQCIEYALTELENK